jgi:hypothetical protein
VGPPLAGMCMITSACKHVCLPLYYAHVHVWFHVNVCVRMYIWNIFLCKCICLYVCIRECVYDL